MDTPFSPMHAIFCAKCTGNPNDKLENCIVLNEHNSVFARSGALYATGVSLGPLESSTQTASRSLQPFWQGSLDDRPTDRPCYSVGNNRWSAQWRSQILLLSMATKSIYWSSRLKYTMPVFSSYAFTRWRHP